MLIGFYIMLREGFRVLGVQGLGFRGSGFRV